jgi:MarR family transcriptional regulator, transcriptional regulator for hemolysin
VTGDHERFIGYLVSDVARLMRTVFDRRVRHLGVTRAQWLALTRLDRRPGASQSDVAEMLEIEKATAGRLIDRLETNGWVERRADPNDRRINRIYLSNTAELLLQSLWPIAAETNNEAMGDLTDEERSVLTDLLGRMKLRLQDVADLSQIDENPATEVVAETGELVP